MSPAATEGIPCCPLLTDNTRTKDRRTATCSMWFFLPLERGYGRWRKKRAEQHKVNKFVFLDAEFSEIRTKERGKKEESIFFLLSLVIAGPGRHLYSTRRKC